MSFIDEFSIVISRRFTGGFYLSPAFTFIPCVTFLMIQCVFLTFIEIFDILIYYIK